MAKGGDASSLIPGWAQLLAAFRSAAQADGDAAVQSSQQLPAAPVAEASSVPAADSAVKGIQLWAQALRTEQQAWDAAAFTPGTRHACTVRELIGSLATRCSTAVRLFCSRQTRFCYGASPKHASRLTMSEANDGVADWAQGTTGRPSQWTAAWASGWRTSRLRRACRAWEPSARVSQKASGAWRCKQTSRVQAAMSHFRCAAISDQPVHPRSATEVAEPLRCPITISQLCRPVAHRS